MKRNLLCGSMLMLVCLSSSIFAGPWTFDEVRNGMFTGWTSAKDGAVLGTETADWFTDLQLLPISDVFGNSQAEIYFSQDDGVVYGAVRLDDVYSAGGANITGVFLQNALGNILFSLAFEPINDPAKGDWISNVAPTVISTGILLDSDGFGQTAFPEGAPVDDITNEAFIYYDLEHDYFLFASRRYDGIIIDVTQIPEVVAEYWVGVSTPEIEPVPEPATLLLVGAASGFGWGLRRFRKKQSK